MWKRSRTGDSIERAGDENMIDGNANVTRRTKGRRITRHQEAVSKPGVTNTKADQSSLPTTTTMEGVMPGDNRRFNRAEFIEGQGIPGTLPLIAKKRVEQRKIIRRRQEERRQRGRRSSRASKGVSQFIPPDANVRRDPTESNPLGTQGNTS